MTKNQWWASPYFPLNKTKGTIDNSDAVGFSGYVEGCKGGGLLFSMGGGSNAVIDKIRSMWVYLGSLLQFMWEVA